MTKNKLPDLNNHLFAQIERLSDETISPEELLTEIEKSKAITHVAQTIINNAALALNAAKFVADNGADRTVVPDMLKIENKNV